MIVDPPRDRIVMFGGAGSEGGTADLWMRSLADTGRWLRVDVLGPRPATKVGGRAFYDPVRQRFVVFGGRYTDGVWALSLSGRLQWSMLAMPGSGPADREGPCVIYDPVGDRLITFGGDLHNDTWALALGDDSGWTQLSPLETPPTTRSNGVAVYDPHRRRMILFSGCDWWANYPHPPTVPDIWALSLDGAPQWTELHAGGDGPPGLYFAAAAYDSTHDRMVVFSGTQWDYGSHNEAWVLQFGDSLTWTRIAPERRPAPRSNAMMVYDGTRDRYVTFGGSGTDTWALTLSPTPAWTELEAGGSEQVYGRYLGPVVYDAARHRTLVMGGHDQYYAEGDYWPSDPEDLWALSFDSRARWTAITRDSMPPGRSGRTAIVDTRADRLIAYGGFGYEDWTFGDVVQLPLSGMDPWRSLEPIGAAPLGRYLHSAIYDSLRDRMIVFGGKQWDRVFNDTWLLSLSDGPAWTRLDSVAAAPPARFGQAAIYDPVGDRMIIFGGSMGTGCFGDLWQLSLSGHPNWSPLDAGPGPSARAFAAMAYDSDLQRIVLFGGRAQDGTALGDLWFLPLVPGAHWIRADSIDTMPAARWGAGSTYDADRGRFVVMHGTLDPCGDIGGAYSDVWAMKSAVVAPAALAAPEVDAHPFDVTLKWHGVSADGFVGSIQRRTDASGWMNLGAAFPTPDGRIVFEDRTASPATRYSYRLVWSVGSAARTSAESWADVPPLRLALVRASANPSTRGLVIALSLPDAAAAQIGVYDIQGRLLQSRDVSGLGPGDHVLELERPGALQPGIYLVRLVHGERSLVVRASVIH